ncbi:4-(cytidine 5'-diphospho)-2-C-methyl-D-erythritol kinase [Guggenheimella bovis]
MIIKAPAKINLNLEILGKREDGYHLLKTLMMPIPLYDTLHINPSDSDHFTCSESSLREGNLVLRALFLLREHVTVPPVTIHLEKRIPFGAGLGGGSSDAAKTLLALRSLFSLPVDDETLHAIASQLGSDVPFFLSDTIQLATGTGTILSPVAPFSVPYLVLFKPSFSLSTKDVYKELKPSDYGSKGNDLEAPAMRLEPRLKAFKEILREGAYYTAMSGSGTSLFSLFLTREEALKVQEKLPGESFLFESKRLSEDSLKDDSNIL